MPVEPNLVPPPPRYADVRELDANGDPIPHNSEKLIARGTLMAVVYAEVGSYAKVADLFGVAQSTVRWWVHETKRRKPEDLQRIADRLKGDIGQLAADRVQEGLLEGDTEFAAELGRKVLHGLGELRTHSSIKSDGPAAIASLTLNITRADPSQPAPDVVEGAVVGRPRELTAVQTAADDE